VCGTYRERLGRGGMGNEFWLENLKGRDNLEDINVDGIRILEWLLGRVAGVD
jgi:hypothetical protein